MTEIGIVSKNDLPTKVAVLRRLASSGEPDTLQRALAGLLVVWFAAELRLSERQSAAVIDYFTERDPEQIVSLKNELFAWLRGLQTAK